MSETVIWTCGKCTKFFETHQQLKRHLEEWHIYVDCKFCNKTIKKGSMYRHVKIFHKPQQPNMKTEFSEEEVNRLNQQLDQQLQQSAEELINKVDKEKSQQFQNVNMEDYMKIFDEATSKPSQYPTDEELKDIQYYWINLSEEAFIVEEQNLLEWAAAAL